MMPIPLLNAPTKAFATENLENASALATTMELHVSALFAQIDAVMPVSASRKNNWQLRLVVCTILLGILTNKLDVSVILADVVLTALCVSCLFS